MRARSILPLASLALLAACVTQKAIPPSIRAIDFLGSDDFIVDQIYRYRIGSTEVAVEVPRGFVTDYASIPTPFRALFARQGRYSRAAVVHDYLYWTQRCSRLQADNLFMIAMKESGVGAGRRSAIYEAVRRGGGVAWRDNARARQAGAPRVVPERYYGLADDRTWPQARSVLVAAGVTDPDHPHDPRGCTLGNTTRVP